jgi:hypothetical protein
MRPAVEIRIGHEFCAIYFANGSLKNQRCCNRATTHQGCELLGPSRHCLRRLPDKANDLAMSFDTAQRRRNGTHHSPST